MPDKYFVDVNGVMDAIHPDCYGQRTVRFPVELALNNGHGSAISYSRFVLNTSKGHVLIETPCPLPVGTKVLLNFYIPPSVMLLGNFSGRVVWANTLNPRKHKGMGVRITDSAPGTLARMEALLEEKQPLFDDSF